jgi:Holliday junction resolvasome RuvABC DNA-binding subunit
LLRDDKKWLRLLGSRSILERDRFGIKDLLRKRSKEDMAKKKTKKDSQSLGDALRTLLMGRKASTQEDICIALEKLGYEINQSKASRLLHKIKKECSYVSTKN